MGIGHGDTEGHEAGDKFIKNAANGINSVFNGNTYRIGGDEFVVITCDIKKDIFEQKVQDAIQKLKGNGISLSYGTSWEQNSETIEKQLIIADHLMYENKLLHYKKLNDSTESEN